MGLVWLRLMMGGPDWGTLWVPNQTGRGPLSRVPLFNGVSFSVTPSASPVSVTTPSATLVSGGTRTPTCPSISGTGNPPRVGSTFRVVGVGGRETRVEGSDPKVSPRKTSHTGTTPPPLYAPPLEELPLLPRLPCPPDTPLIPGPFPPTRVDTPQVDPLLPLSHTRYSFFDIRKERRVATPESRRRAREKAWWRGGWGERWVFGDAPDANHHPSSHLSSLSYL